MRNRLHVGKVGMARYQKWRRSLLIRGLEKNNRLGTMHTSDHCISVWYKNISSFTPSSEVLRRLLKNNNDDENRV